LGAAAAKGLSTAAGTQLESAYAPSSPKGVYEIYLTPLGEDPHIAHLAITIHPGSGEILGIQDSRKRRVLRRLMTDWGLFIHGGRVAGLPGRIFIFLSGIALAVLFVTGLLYWFRRRRTARVRTSALAA
jgi:uncharacterized iron-regulated membrane protein